MLEKVLVVDSDTATRLNAMATLMGAGYQMCIADDAFSALSVATQQQPDLIVIADSVARRGSLPLVGRLFSSPETAAIPVVVVADSPESQQMALQAGARGVLPGPASEADFLRFIADHLQLSGPLPRAPKSVLEDPDRLAAVEALRPGPNGDPDLDRFTQLAARMLNAPVSLITLIDKDQQLYASQVGLAPPGTQIRADPLEASFCQFAVTSRQTLRIDDAANHPLVSANPSLDALNAKSYVGIPLLVRGGQAVGALCAIDTTPRHWSDHEVAILGDLAEILTAHLDTVPANTGRHATA